MLLSWPGRLLFVIAALIVGLALPDPRIAQVDKHVPLTGLVILVTLALFGVDLIREHSALKKRRWVRRLVAIITTFATMASLFKGTIEFRIWRFDPIREASGMGFINFEKLIDSSEFGFLRWYPLTPPIEIRSAITGGISLGTFSMIDAKLTTGRKIVNGVETEERCSRITFRISSEALVWPNRLETVSAKDFTKTCNYLDLPLASLPGDVTYDGVVYLTLNGDQFHTFPIPKAYPSRAPRVFVPLNDGARNEMMKYKLYNPNGGTLEHFIHIPEPTPRSFGDWPP